MELSHQIHGYRREDDMPPAPLRRCVPPCFCIRPGIAGNMFALIVFSVAPAHKRDAEIAG